MLTLRNSVIFKHNAHRRKENGLLSGELTRCQHWLVRKSALMRADQDVSVAGRGCVSATPHLIVTISLRELVKTRTRFAYPRERKGQ